MKNYLVEQSQEKISKYGIMICNIYNHLGDVPYYTAPHIHLDVEIMYVQIGSFAVEIDGKEYTAEQGECMLFRSNAVHSIRALSEGVSFYRVLKVGLPFVMSLASTDNSESYVHCLSVSSRGEKVKWSREETERMKIYENFANMNGEYQKDEWGSDIATKMYVAYILQALLRDIRSKTDEKKEDRHLSKAIADVLYYMYRHYSEPITLETCSKWASLSSSYLSRSFKKVTGNSFRNYLNIIRIDAAEKLLITTELSVTEVALECGYNDVSYFAAWYRKIKGITPSDLRKQKSLCAQTDKKNM